MIKRIFYLACTLLVIDLSSQMPTGGKTKYGNEWIDLNKTYLKVSVSKDGVYRVPFSLIEAQGLSTLDADKLQVWNFGQQIPILVVNNKDDRNKSYLEFIGYSHKNGLDTFLYANWRNGLLNPNYSLNSDINGYFITLGKNASESLRYRIENPSYSENLPSSQTSFRYKLSLNYSNQFFKPEEYQLKFSHYVESEGFSNGLRSTVLTEFNTPFRSNNGKNARLDILGQTTLNIFSPKVVSLNGVEIGKDSTSKFKTIRLSYNLDASNLKDNNSLLISGSNQSSLFGVSHVSISYDRAFNMDGIDFTEIDAEGEKLITFNKALPNSYLFDISNTSVISLDVSSTKLITKANSKIAYTNDVRTVTNLSKLQPLVIQPNTSYLILTSRKLASTNKGQEGIDRYKAYRSTTAGGGYIASVVFVEDMYNHFGYGVDYHHHIFKNFAHYLKANFPTIQFVLLLGKGREYYQVRSADALASSAHATYFIPTYGNSPSDNLLFSSGDNPNPLFSIGRVPAKHGDDINNYLDKAIEHDRVSLSPQTKDKLWLKNVVHLGGGGTEGEQIAIRQFLENMGSILAGSKFGASVSGFYKNTSVNVQAATNDQLAKNINEGASIISFFGHASVGTFDYSLDNPRNYTNDGKCPYIFSLGCYSGNIHTPSMGMSEEFTFIPKKGAIGFIAAAGTATLSSQGVYGLDYYEKIGSDYYGKTIGEMVKIICEENKDNKVIDPYTFYQQLTLTGDPAVRITSFQKPDYSIDPSTVNLVNNEVFASNDSFKLNYDLINIGLNVNQLLKIRYTLSKDGSVYYEKVDSVPASPNRSNITVCLPVIKTNAGINQFNIFLDPANNISESDENNNILKSINGNKEYEIIIQSEEVILSHPYNYAEVDPSKKLQLIVSSSNSFAPPVDFVIKIDTTELFNSPLLKSESYKNKQVHTIWEPNINLLEGVTYYWRVETMNKDTRSIKTSSFTATKVGDEGFRQQHYYQFLKNNSNQRITQNRTRYPKAERIIKIDNGYAQYVGTTVGFSVELSTYAISVRPWEYLSEGVSFTINDTITGANLNNNDPSNGSVRSSARGALNSYGFSTSTSSDRKKVIDFIKNHIPKGSLVTFITVLSSPNSLNNINEWESDTTLFGTSIFKLLKERGALLTDKLAQSGVPYTFAFQNELKKPIAESIATSKEKIISTTITMDIEATSSYSISEKIGPSSSWQSVDIKYASLPSNNSNINIYGFTSNNVKELLINSKINNSIDISSIPANKYPFIQYEILDSNTLQRIPTQIYSIRIPVKLLPDIILLGSDKSITDSIYKGQVINVSIPAVIVNLKDSLCSDFIVDVIDNNNKTFLIQKSNACVSQTNNTLKILATVNTDSLSTDFRLNAVVNKLASVKENRYDNNIATKKISLLKDKDAPIIELFANNTRITNGEILPPDNKFMVKISDKYLFGKNLWKKENILVRISDQSNKTVYTSETGAINTFKITEENNNLIVELDFTTSLPNGKYQIFVSAKDGEGNTANKDGISFNFEIISEVGIRNLYNYPNPFSRSTQFVYTVTGTIPSKVLLTIYSISGKVVNQVMLSDHDLIKSGNNLSKYRYDGTDSFGNKLANGVYLFTIQALDIKGEKIGDGKDFGKMVITR